MRKRMLALLLSLIMAAGLLPATALAGEGDTAGGHGPRAEHTGWTAWTDEKT